VDEVDFLGRRVPFGNDLLFEAPAIKGFVLHAEICEDVWTPIPPSTFAALAGATVLLNARRIIGAVCVRRSRASAWRLIFIRRRASASRLRIWRGTGTR